MSGQDGAKVFEAFNQAFPGDDARVSLIAEAWMLLGQAARALDADVHTGTVLLCRATLESAFFLFLTRKWDKGVLDLKNPLDLSGEIRSVEFDEIYAAIKKRIKFSTTETEAISRIQKDGNLIAHFANRRVKAVKRWGEEAIRVSKKMNETMAHRVVTPEEWRRAMEQIDKNVKIWVSRDEAVKDLRDTASILGTVIRSISNT